MTKANRAKLAKLRREQGTLNALCDIACIRREMDKVAEIRVEMSANYAKMQALQR